MNKILVIQTASIGDVILITPVLENLHKNFPDAKIDLLIKSSNKTLFDSHPFVNLIIWDKSKKKYKSLFNLLKNIRNEKYDAVFNAHRFASSGFLTAFSKSKKRVGFKKNPFSFLFTEKIDHIINNDDSKHETERNLDLIASVCSGNMDIRPKLYPSDKDFAEIAKYNKNEKTICISPASLWFTKQFPTDKWIELINNIDKSFSIFLLGSKNDYNLSEKIIGDSSNKNITNLCGKLSLLQSAAFMSKVKYNIMNDSAPMHLASSLNSNTIAIFCSTVPEFGFGPLSENSNIIQINENLECRPCGLHGHKNCPEGHFNCANKIDIKDIIKIITNG